MGDKIREVESAGSHGRHFIFTTETAAQAAAVIAAYKKGAPSSGAVRRIAMSPTKG
jgi:indole-3-glycerol phosphate synthase